MFILAIFIGIYSYLIFILGLVGLLTKIIILWITILWSLSLLFVKKKSLISIYQKLLKLRFDVKRWYISPIALFIVLIVLLALVNFIGALGPELAFDALWYHLTLPKLYLLHFVIYHIPGGLLYYSDMPKLGEMLYVGALALGNEITAKVIHFFFGIFVVIVLYRMSRKFFTQFISLLVVVIFYSNLVVDWESITSYIDLIRTFFELLALWGFLNWYESEETKWLAIAGLMTGFAITTKVLALGSFMIFCLMILYDLVHKTYVLRQVKQRSANGNLYLKAYVNLFLYIIITLIVPLPWFLFSYIHTGNPVYPFFTNIYQVNPSSPNPLQIIPDLWNLFIHSSDPISPIYLIFFPLLFITVSKFRKEIWPIIWYCGLSLLLWYFTPQTGGGRFIVPYLPAFSLVCGAIYSEIIKKTRIEWRYISRLLLFVVVFVAFISSGYRFVANSKYLPVVIGKETASQFLTNHLNFSFGDFYDTDYYFAKHIKRTDSVLLYGFHNLYYIDFPFKDNSWIMKGDTFTYVATQKTKLPARFKDWQLIYSNDKTMVQLYEPPKGACQKVCYY